MLTPIDELMNDTPTHIDKDIDDEDNTFCDRS